MNNRKETVDQFLSLLNNHAQDGDILHQYAMITAFAHLLQDTINHPFRDGGQEVDFDKNSWKNWRDSHFDVLNASRTLEVNDETYEFRFRLVNLTDGHEPDFNPLSINSGVTILMHASLIDFYDPKSISDHLQKIMDLIKNRSQLDEQLDWLRDDDTWTYVIPNIVYYKK